MKIFQQETEKSVEEFVSDLTEMAKESGFTIHKEDKMEMAHTFGLHGVEVAENFDLHMMQVCKPEKAAKSLGKNLERAVLMPKFIITVSDKGKTQIRFLHYTPESVRTLIDDDEFPDSLAESISQIINFIDAAR
mgnify:CR=1 FL=1